MPTDPVCGMAVEDAPDALRLSRDNRTYYFCSHECLQAFAAPEEARRRLARRLAVAWPLAVLTAFLTWRPLLPGSEYVAGALAAVVQFYPGSVFYVGARDALRQRVGNMDLLIAVGTTAAFLYSVAVLALPGRLAPSVYFDASALIVTVILTGNYLEALTRRRAGSALRKLAEMLPTTAIVLAGGSEKVRPRDELQAGERVRVRPGERFPADGTVAEGISSVDEALLTGEATPVRKGPGASVLAGSKNGAGSLVVEVRRTGPDTFVASVGRLLQDAELSRVPLQRQADRLASVFAPFTLALAAVTGALWFVLAREDPTVGILVFVTVAVTACPCAFGLATPAALLVGTGRAADEGILFRGGDAIERAARIDTVLLDKTGTLTASSLSVGSVGALAPVTEAEVLSTAAGLETGIDHPFAEALLREAARRGVGPEAFTERRLEPGRGVVGHDGRRSACLLRGDGARAEHPDLGPLEPWIAASESEGRSWSLVVRDGHPIGAVSFRNPLAPGASEALAELVAEGVRVTMVTGDNDRAARSVARAVGIGDVHAGVLPEGKVALVRQYQGEGHAVAFVGDGINDAAALAAADLGVALGTGSEVAKESGQVLLVRSDLRDVPRALHLARAIVGRVRRNLLWAIGYNAVLLPIAAGALVPTLGLGIYRYLPVLGAVAMGLSSTTVLLNSLSLRWAPLGRAGPKGLSPLTTGPA